jgi:hypothetical protein
MAFKREMLAELRRLQARSARLLAEFDEPIGAVPGVVIEGRIVGDAIITEAETD